MSESTFGTLPLAKPLQLALSEHNYHTPSPIQAQAIPFVLKGRDLMGCAQTGTGKTAAFALPMLHRLHENPINHTARCPRCLVLTPTRELAVQIADNFVKYSRHMDTSIATVYGGVGQMPQVRALKPGVDVLVATPGRLLDLFNQRHVRLDRIETLVLDEADRMLDMGFLPDMRRIIREIPENRQTLFFSATLSPAIRKLAESILREPESVSVAPESTTAERVDHSICFVRRDDKPAMLTTLLQHGAHAGLSLVFSKTKHGADRIARNLDRSGIKAGVIHGNKSQNARQRALDQFRTGRTPVLVATDVAARGIDVKNIALVINFDLPNEAESYVHRIGRTARAGESGRALSFCSEGDFDLLRDIESLIRKPVNVHSSHDYHDGSLADGYARRIHKGAARGNSGANRGRAGRRKGARPGGGGFNHRFGAGKSARKPASL